MVTRSTLVRVASIAVAVGALAIGCLFFALASMENPLPLLAELSEGFRVGAAVSWVFAALMLSVIVFQFLYEHGIRYGLRYAWKHWRITRKVKLQLRDAGYAIQRQYTVEMPKVKLKLSPDCRSGELRIGNTIKFNVKLDNVDVSAALGDLVVEQHYATDDANWYIYELLDGSTNYKQTFDSFEKFLSRLAEISNYKLFLDNRTIVKLQHILVVGATGSGKTYALYSLLLQMLNLPTPCELYYADPKNSSLAVVGDAIAPERTATELSEIVALLGRFVAAMNDRKQDLKVKLHDRLDADYSDFGMNAHVMVIDEYASFAASLATMEKTERENAKKWIREIVLQGRQLGFFIVLAMQKSDATLIDTAIRDSMTLKIVLGNAEDTTYTTAFGAGVPIPNRNYPQGDGVFTEPSIAAQPKLVQFPVLAFDILAAANGTPVA